MSKRQSKETSPEILSMMKAIGLKIRKYRLEKGINSVEFCEIYNINRMTLYRIETGLDFNMSSFLQILDALGITPNEFFKGETEDLD